MTEFGGVYSLALDPMPTCCMDQNIFSDELFLIEYHDWVANSSQMVNRPVSSVWHLIQFKHAVWLRKRRTSSSTSFLPSQYHDRRGYHDRVGGNGRTGLGIRPQFQHAI